jgi:hypothetical protein
VYRRSIDAKRDVVATPASVGRTHGERIGADDDDGGVYEWTFWIVTVDYASRCDGRRVDDGDWGYGDRRERGGG